MRYPESSLPPDHLTKIAAIERFAGSWYSLNRLSTEQRSELRDQSLLESTAALLRLEGRGTELSLVERTLASLKQHELDFSQNSEEILGLHGGFRSLTETRLKEEELLDPGILLEVHSILLEEVPTLRQSRGRFREEALTVQAFKPSGDPVGDVFLAPPPEEVEGLLEETFAGMRAEIAERRWHPLLLHSWFLARLLSIQPFDHASIRSVHLFGEMLLLAEGYGHTNLHSLPAILEAEAGAYFVALRRYQRSMDSDQGGLADWQSFFLECLVKQAAALRARQKEERSLNQLPPLSEALVRLAGEEGKITLGQATKATGANRNTVKVHLKNLVDTGALARMGSGKGTWYCLP